MCPAGLVRASAQKAFCPKAPSINRARGVLVAVAELALHDAVVKRYRVAMQADICIMVLVHRHSFISHNWF